MPWNIEFKIIWNCNESIDDNSFDIGLLENWKLQIRFDFQFIIQFFAYVNTM